MENDLYGSFNYTLEVFGKTFQLVLYEHTFRRYMLRTASVITTQYPSAKEFADILYNSVQAALPAIVRKLPHNQKYRGFVVDDQVSTLIYTMSVKGNQIRVQTMFSSWKKTIYIGQTDKVVCVQLNSESVPTAKIITDLSKSRFSRKAT